MRAMVMVAGLAVLASACGEEPRSQSQRQIDDERAIAEVEAAQTPPPDVVTPERITDAERERYRLSDSGCAFAVASPEIGAQAILQINVGYMKFDGRMERFAPDAGAGGGPAGTSTRYDGGTHALLISFDTARTAKVTGGVSIPTRITLQDGRRRTVYVAEGVSLCG